MKDGEYLHFAWFLWLLILSIVITGLPLTAKVKVNGTTTAYQTVGTLKLNNSPYLVVPVYVANKDMRSWYYMRAADQVIEQSKKVIDLPKGNQ